MAPYTHFTQALADASLRNMVQADQEHDTSGWVLEQRWPSAQSVSMWFDSWHDKLFAPRWFDVMQKASHQLRSNIANATRNRGDKVFIFSYLIDF